MRWWVFIKLGRPRRAAAAPAIPAAAAASVGRRGLLLARAEPGRAAPTGRSLALGQQSNFGDAKLVSLRVFAARPASWAQCNKTHIVEGDLLESSRLQLTLRDRLPAESSAAGSDTGELADAASPTAEEAHSSGICARGQRQNHLVCINIPFAWRR